MKEIAYHKEGDYLIPNLAVKGTESEYHIGLYGSLKLEYMKKHQLGLYSDLILNGTLPAYLIEIDKNENDRVKNIINELAKAENVDEEIVLNELIYC